MEFEGRYLTYDEYSELGGTLSESAFNLLEYKSRKKIDEETFGRLITLPTQKEEVKLCIYELIIKQEEYKNSSSDVKSESVDGYSISYNTKTTKEQAKELNGIIRTYLINCRLDDGTPYLYRGV